MTKSRGRSTRSARTDTTPGRLRARHQQAMAARRAILAKYEPQRRPFIERALSLDRGGEEYRRFVDEGLVPGTDADRRRFREIENAREAELAAWERQYGLTPGTQPTSEQIMRIGGAAQSLAEALQRTEMPDCPAHLAQIDVRGRWAGLRRALDLVIGPRLGTRVRVKSAGSPSGAWPPFEVAVHLGMLRRCVEKVGTWLGRWDRAKRRPDVPPAVTKELERSAEGLRRSTEAVAGRQDETAALASARLPWPSGAFSSGTDLAGSLNVPPKKRGAFYKRLQRFREKHSNDSGYVVSVEGSGPRDARYLHSVQYVYAEICKGLSTVDDSVVSG